MAYLPPICYFSDNQNTRGYATKPRLDHQVNLTKTAKNCSQTAQTSHFTRSKDNTIFDYQHLVRFFFAKKFTVSSNAVYRNPGKRPQIALPS